MAIGALIGAYQEDDSGGLRALLPLAGRTLLEYQARCVAAAGAAHVQVANKLDRGIAEIGAGTFGFRRALIADSPCFTRSSWSTTTARGRDRTICRSIPSNRIGV